VYAESIFLLLKRKIETSQHL